LIWLAGLVLDVVWELGLILVLSGGLVAHSTAASVALGVPLVSLAAQFPLWLARQFFGWRLVREDSATNPLGMGEGGSRGEPGDGGVADNSASQENQNGPDRKLAIRDLMLATVVVAVSLALVRLAPADGQDVWPVRSPMDFRSQAPRCRRGCVGLRSIMAQPNQSGVASPDQPTPCAGQALEEDGDFS
jgi:hypothetical protein